MTTQEYHSKILVHRASLMAFAVSLINNHDREAAADLLQDTYLKALTYRDKLVDNSNIKAWLFTIMKNTFINEYRRIKRNPADNVEDLARLSVTTTETPEVALNAIELELIISQVSPDCQQALRLHIQGFKYREIAEQLGINLGTIKSRIFFARKQAADLYNNKKPFLKHLTMSDNIVLEEPATVQRWIQSVIQFRKLCAGMLNAGKSYADLCRMADLSSLTFMKAYKHTINDLVLRQHVLDKIKTFNFKYSQVSESMNIAAEAVHGPKSMLESLQKPINDQPELQERLRQEGLNGKHVDKAVTDEALIFKHEDIEKNIKTPVEDFWSLLGKAMAIKPADVHIVINTIEPCTQAK